MGRFQAPIYTAKRTLCQFAKKAYLWNAAAAQLGFKGMDRKAAPPLVPPAAGAAAAPECGDDDKHSAGLKAVALQTWTETASNQLDRAAYLYGCVEHFWIQQIIVRSLVPCQEFHTRYGGCIKGSQIRPILFFATSSSW